MKIYDYNGKKEYLRRTYPGSTAETAAITIRPRGALQVEGVIMERDSISRVEIGTRFVPDYEIPIFAKVLGVSVLWILGIE